MRSPSSSWPVASIGSLGRPRARTKTFVEPAGTTPSAGTSVVHAVGEQPVDDLVDGAVAAEGDHDVGAVAHRPAGQRGGVPAVGGLGDLELGDAAERVGQDVAFSPAVAVARGLTTTKTRTPGIVRPARVETP